MKTLIIIPTYWTLPEKRTEDIFDHPIPISRNSPLSRALENLSQLKVKEEIVILPTPATNKVMDKTKKITKKFTGLNITLFDSALYKKTKDIMIKSRMPDSFRKEINPNDYGGIRNRGFIAGALLKADNLIHLDDDGIIREKNYFKLAMDGIGQKINGKKLVAKTGYYVSENNVLNPSQFGLKFESLWEKRKYMKNMFKEVKSKKRFFETSMALGGNMIINKELYNNVPFDPAIPRGEDMDLLFSARHFGYNFLFDNKMAVVHLPPKKHTPYWSHLRRDVYRFVYQREKLKFLNLKLSSLDDYPRCFLGEDLEYKAAVTSINYAKICLQKRKMNDFNESLYNVNLFLKDAQIFAKKFAPMYFKFQKDWKRFMKTINNYS